MQYEEVKREKPFTIPSLLMEVPREVIENSDIRLLAGTTFVIENGKRYLVQRGGKVIQVDSEDCCMTERHVDKIFGITDEACNFMKEVWDKIFSEENIHRRVSNIINYLTPNDGTNLILLYLYSNGERPRYRYEVLGKIVSIEKKNISEEN